jgi:two-component system sensor histidine kinase UhpB
MGTSDTPAGAGREPTRAQAVARWHREGPAEDTHLLGPKEVRHVLSYVVFASLWIVGSDLFLEWMDHSTIDSISLQTVKGLNFVFTTAILLFFVLRRSFDRWRIAEAELRESEQRFASVARAVTSALWDWDLATDVIWWSDGFFKRFGYVRVEFEPTLEAWQDMIHPADRDRVVGSLDRYVEQEDADGVWMEEYRLRRRDGSYAIVFDRGVLIRDRQGRPHSVVGGLADISERRGAEENLERSHRQLRALSGKLQSLREAERTRIAREIHDELGQMLTALKMDLRWIERRLTQQTDASLNPLLDKIVAASEIVDATIGGVQRIAFELRPGVLDTLGLSAGVHHEAIRFQQRTDVLCRVQCPDFSPPPSDEVTTTTFRILQEALTNVARHAQASEVSIVLATKDNELELVVADNGRGIPREALGDPNSLGLVGMQERAALLGGHVTLSQAPRGGTVVTLRLPLVALPPGVSAPA